MAATPSAKARGESNLPADRPVRLGVIGCGRIAQAAHLPAIAKTDEVELIAVADPSLALANGVGDLYGVKSYVNTEDLLADDVDAVVIATPDRFHHPLGVLALRAGKHVLMVEAARRSAENNGEKVQL